MAKPVRINEMRIVLAPLDKVSTHVDSDFREPIGVKQRPAEVIVTGQVNLGLVKNKRFELVKRSRTGDVEDLFGRLVFKKTDLVAQGVMIEKGWKVLRAGPSGSETIIDGVIIEVRPESPLNGDFLLIYVEFEYDREKKESLTR